MPDPLVLNGFVKVLKVKSKVLFLLVTSGSSFLPT